MRTLSADWLQYHRKSLVAQVGICKFCSVLPFTAALHETVEHSTRERAMQLSTMAPAGQAGKVVLKPASAAKAFAHAVRPVRYLWVHHDMQLHAEVFYQDLLLVQVAEAIRLPSRPDTVGSERWQSRSNSRSSFVHGRGRHSSLSRLLSVQYRRAYCPLT